MYHVMCSTGLSALIGFMFDKYSQSVALRLGFSCGGIAHNVLGYDKRKRNAKLKT